MDYPIQTSSQLTIHLKSMRQAKGLSQAALGKLLGVGQVRIANIENDPGAISVEQLIKILQLLDTRLCLQENTPSALSSSSSENNLEW